MGGKQGRKPLAFEDRVINCPVRLLPHEIETINELADLAGITPMQWKRNALRLCIEAAKRKELA